jgi:O-antigen ligase
MRKYAYFLSLVLIFTIPWEGVVRIPGIGNLATAIGLMVGAFWLITVLATFQVRTPSLFQLIACLFVCWNALSIFWSTDPKTTAGQALTWIQLFLMAYIFWDLFTTRATILGGLQMYVLGAYVAIGGALVNFRHGNVFYTFYQRYSPGDTHPDGFGFALALGIPIAWYLATSDMPTKLSKLLKFVNYAYIPAAFLGLALSGTRTALIASIPGMIFGIASLTRVRPWARILIVLCLSSAILFMLPRLQTLRSFERFGTIPTELTQGDLNNRTNNWREGFDTFLEHPFLGVGGNKYRSVNDLYHVAHNSYLSVLVEHGLVGFVLFAGILMISVINAIRQPKRDAMFWLTVLLVWSLGASTLTWEDRKSTWLLLSLLTASAALSQPHKEDAISSAPIASPRRTQGTRKDVPVTSPQQALPVQMRPISTTGKGRAANRKT